MRRHRDLPPDREAERRKAIELDRRLNVLQRKLGTITFRCYVCGSESTTYVGTPTDPPDPLSVMRREDVVPITTCGKNYCMRMEQMRQDSLIQTLIAPERDAYFARRAEEREAAKKGKR